MLLTLLGVNNYGNRSIAKVRDNKDELSKTFWSIYLFQLLTGIVMLLFYAAYIIIFDNQYALYATIEILFILSSILDINWLFFGLEEFKKTITRNTFVKLGTLALIFALIRTPDDLWKYVLIMSAMTLLGQLLLWYYLKGQIRLVKVSIKDVKKHIKPNLTLFVPVIAVSIYKIMDKIMIGGISDISEVGYYESAEKIIQVPLAFISALGTVMLPRVSNMLSNGGDKKAMMYLSKSIAFVMFLSSIMACSLVAIGYEFAPLFFGDDFQKAGTIIMILSVTILFVSFANVIRTQYLIPKEKDKIYIRSVFLGAIINLAMNLIFIPPYGSIGACFGTIAAEFIVMFYQAFAVRRELPICQYLKQSFPFLIKAIITFGFIYPLNLVNFNPYVRLAAQILAGVAIYSLLNFRYISSIIDFKTLKTKLTHK